MSLADKGIIRISNTSAINGSGNSVIKRHNEIKRIKANKNGPNSIKFLITYDYALFFDDKEAPH